MFFVLSESSLAGIFLEVVCGDCELDEHIFHRTTLAQLPLFYHTVFKDFLLFSGRVESRDNICIIENLQIDRNHTCMYLPKSHLSSA